MAPRKVIADSEDEDEEDDAQMYGAEGDTGPPEAEPLSPHHRPSGSGAATAESLREESDVTDPSFFARLYDDHQSLAVQQSNLIEHIVRQSQRASASSGDVSFPTKLKGRNANPSSGSNVTSPLALGRSQVYGKLISDGASEFTTPHKSVGQEWEVPSSPEDETVSHTMNGSRSKLKTYGRSGRRGSKQASSPAATKKAITAGENALNATFEGGDLNYQLPGDQCTELPPPPTVRDGKASQQHTVVPDAANFYIAQSNLTTMQRLEYQKVNTSVHGFGGLPGSLAHYKSSGVSTIAYPTPTGYSSIPPFPGEESPRQNEIIPISSSPDLFTSGYAVANEQGPAVEEDVEALALEESCEMPRAHRIPVPAGKEKRKLIEMDVEDELNDPAYDADGVGIPQETYKPRPTKRRSLAAGSPGNEASAGPIKPVVHEKDKAEAEVQATNSMPDTLEMGTGTGTADPQPEPIPKKRGRKKKQPATEPPPEEAKEVTGSVPVEDIVAPSETIAESEAVMEKPKKKRGRPRKTDTPKAADKTQRPGMEDEMPKTNSLPLQSDNDLSEPISIPKEREECVRSMANNRKRKISTDEEDEEEESKEDRDRSPLEERDTGRKSPTKHNLSGEGLTAAIATATTTAKAIEPDKPKDGDTKSAQQKTAKAAAAAAKSVISTPSKVTYRVGLSKRSRIAPLLKTIKK